LAAAEALVRERGAPAFSLRECARRAGVSHSAPGHHFGDVTGLLTAVAVRSFERLQAELRATRQGDVAMANFEALMRRYVTFAMTDPVLFRLMFHSDQVACDDARLMAAGGAAYGELVAAVTAVNPHAGKDEATIRFSWATIHGTAMLLIDGPLAPVGGRAEDVAALVEGMIRRIVHTVATFGAS
jgi:AcrR family transcriptional regulator